MSERQVGKIFADDDGSLRFVLNAAPYNGEPDKPALEARAFFDSRLRTIGKQASGVSSAPHKTCVWHHAGRLRALNAAYAATSDARYLDIATQYANNLLANRDDRDGGDPDVHRGRVIRGWSLDDYVSYGPGGTGRLNTCWLAHTGNICAEVLCTAALWQGSARKGVVSECIASLHEHDAEWVHEEGQYADICFKNYGAATPLNMQCLMGLAWLRAAQANNDDALRDIPTRLARTVREQLLTTWGDYVWTYRPHDGRVEDFGHGSVVSRFCCECAEAGIEFDAGDVATLGKTHRRLWLNNAGWYNFLDGTQLNPRSSGITTPWLYSAVSAEWGRALFETDPVARQNVYEWFASRDWDVDSTVGELAAAAMLMGTY